MLQIYLSWSLTWLYFFTGLGHSIWQCWSHRNGTHACHSDPLGSQGDRSTKWKWSEDTCLSKTILEKIIILSSRISHCKDLWYGNSGNFLKYCFSHEITVLYKCSGLWLIILNLCCILAFMNVRFVTSNTWLPLGKHSLNASNFFLKSL